MDEFTWLDMVVVCPVNDPSLNVRLFIKRENNTETEIYNDGVRNFTNNFGTFDDIIYKPKFGFILFRYSAYENMQVFICEALGYRKEWNYTGKSDYDKI